MPQWRRFAESARPADPTLSAFWRGPIWLILAAFLALGAAYSVINPLFESPDEVWHYEYVRWLVEGHGLPRPEQIGSAGWNQEGSQPPLYYLLAALLTRPVATDNAAAVIRYNPHAAMGQPASTGNKNVMLHGQPDAWPWHGVALAAHLARFLSLLFGALGVACVYATALVIFPGRSTVAATAAALVAFNPQFIFLSAAVNNDILVTTCCAVGLLACVSLLSTPARGSDGDRPPTSAPWWMIALLGALVGAAALSKLSGLALAGPAAVTLLLWGWRRRSLREFLLAASLAAALALLVAGWWYGRNWLLYRDFTGLPAMFDVLPRRSTAPGGIELLNRAQGVWRSLWAVFGWFNVLTADWLVNVYTALCLAGLAGLALAPLGRSLQRRLARPRQPDRSLAGASGPAVKRTWDLTLVARNLPARTLQLAVLLLWVLIVVTALYQWAQMRYPQGRLLFPAFGAAAILLAQGLHYWLPRRLIVPASTALALGLFILAAIVPFVWIAPAYAAPAPLPAGAFAAQPPLADFQDQIQLRGYRLEAEGARPGQTVYVTLFWQAIRPVTADYSVFVHLDDQYGITQAQNDSYPAAGALPTSAWLPGAIIPDRHAVVLPETAPAPARLRLVVGLYDKASGLRLRTTTADAVRLAYADIEPRIGPDGLPNPVNVDFDGQIGLRGFSIGREVVQPGETLEVRLWWKALAEPHGDYVAFAHLILPPEAVWAQADQMPRGQAGLTSKWQPGQVVSDTYRLSLPANAPVGVYTVEIGLYDRATMDRLPVNFSDKGVVIGRVKVSSEAPGPGDR